jgi:hypothetical protein
MFSLSVDREGDKKPDKNNCYDLRAVALISLSPPAERGSGRDVDIAGFYEK